MRNQLFVNKLRVVIGLIVLLIYQVSTAEPKMTEEQRMMHEFMGIEYIDGKAVRVRPPKIEKYPEPPDPYEGMTAEQKEGFILQRKKHTAEIAKAMYCPVHLSTGVICNKNLSFFIKSHITFRVVCLFFFYFSKNIMLFFEHMLLQTVKSIINSIPPAVSRPPVHRTNP